MHSIAEQLRQDPALLAVSEWRTPTGLDNLIRTASNTIEVQSHRWGLGVRELTSGNSLIGYGVLFTIVAGTLANEVNLLSKGPVDINFAIRYARENILPSIIWLTPPNELIALAVGRSTEILQNLDPAYIATLAPAEAQQAAERALAVYGSQFLRWASVGALALNKIVQLVNIGSEAKRIFTEKVSGGKASLLTGWERLIQGDAERIIRLAGSQSDVTEYDLAHTDHIIPIFENPARIQPLIDIHLRKGAKPFYWHIPSSQYGEASAWEGFRISKNWLTRTKKGSKVFILEADASVGDQALALGTESANDLDIQEISQGFRAIERLAQESKVIPDQVVKVILADSSQPIGPGKSDSYTLRDQNDRLHHADILIDARAPLLQGIEEWLQTRTDDTHKTVIFNTTNEEYFKTISEVLSSKGYQVIRWDPRETYDMSIPHLVYQNITSDTIETTRVLIQNKLVNPAYCCPLLDRISGLEHLDQLKSELKITEDDRFEGICSAKIYSDLFRLVRTLIRMDYSTEQIQKIFDDAWVSYFPKKNQK